MILRTEEEIRKGWTGEAPVVSVICPTYNQQGYLPAALDSFLSQQTPFPFEIIVHDDASTDGTPQVIADYARRYPGIIRPVYQEVNQFSQGKACMLIAASHARGEYLAFCEGDDYWSDPCKLAIQTEAMRRHPECQVSFHWGRMVPDGSSALGTPFCRRARSETIFSTRRIILQDGAFMPTASLCFTRDFFDSLLRSPDPFFGAHSYDFFLQVFASLRGGALYIDRDMSVYRHMSAGSWSQSMVTDGRYYLNWMRKVVDALNGADRLTGRRFTREFAAAVQRRHGAVLRSELLPLEVRREYFLSEHPRIGTLNRFMWHSVYRHQAANRALASLKPVFKWLRSQLVALRAGR